MVVRRVKIRAVVWLLGMLVPALMARPVRAGPEDCLECHSKPQLTRDGKPPLTLESFLASVHGRADCTGCHIGEGESGYEVFPHESGDEGPQDCRFCHALGKTVGFPEIIKEYDESVHEQRMGEKFRCSSCHDPHTMAMVDRNLPREKRIDLGNKACLMCHADSAFRVAAADGDEIPPSSTHDWLPSLDKHARMRCVVCHTAIEGDKDHLILPKERAVRACDACHDTDAPIIRKYLGLDQKESWVTNPILFEMAYLPGTTRNRLADTVILALFGLTIAGALGHGLIRMKAGSGRAPAPYQVVTTDLYPLGLRLWHWANAVLFIVLAFTGLRMHFGGRWGMGMDFESAFNLHNLVGVALLLLAVSYFVMNFATRNAGQYFGPPQDGVHGVVAQAKYYLVGIFKSEPHPYHSTKDQKFNPLQKVTYFGVMYVLFPILIASGIVLLFPKSLPETVLDRPGVWWFATAHYLSACGLILFLLGHLYLATTGDKPSYLVSAMLTGRHRHHEPEDAKVIARKQDEAE